jgi:hypothetical protein
MFLPQWWNMDHKFMAQLLYGLFCLQQNIFIIFLTVEVQEIGSLLVCKSISF